MQISEKIQNRLGESREDYLKVIYALTNGTGGAKPSHIARQMNVKRPSVTSAMKRLRDDGLVCYESRGAIFLTEAGLSAAKTVADKHMILWRWLRSIGVAEEQADAEACRIEHDLSDETLRLLKAAMDTASESHSSEHGHVAG